MARLLKIAFVFLLMVLIGIDNDAFGQQRNNRRRPATTRQNNNSGNPFGGANTPAQNNTPASGDPFGRPAQQPPSGDPFNRSNNQQPASGDPFSNRGAATNRAAANRNPGDTNIVGSRNGLPLTVVAPSSQANPLADSIPVFLRPETAVDDNNTKIADRPPLAYEHIREDDAVFRHKIWRIIDAREKINLPFAYNSNEENGNQLFFAILYRAVSDSASGITAFSDENFTTPLTREEFKMKTSGGVDTSEVYDLMGEVSGYEVRVREFPIDSIYSFQIKEEVIFDKESSRLITRIIGIAPMGPIIIGGKTFPGPHQPVFWLYYPEIREVLSKYKAYNPKNMGARLTWEDVFESRFFSSYIVKSTMDNPGNQTLAQLQQNPLFRLYEGEKIKEKIFDYEQNLWSY